MWQRPQSLGALRSLTDHWTADRPRILMAAPQRVAGVEEVSFISLWRNRVRLRLRLMGISTRGKVRSFVNHTKPGGRPNILRWRNVGRIRFIRSYKMINNNTILLSSLIKNHNYNSINIPKQSLTTWNKEFVLKFRTNLKSFLINKCFYCVRDFLIDGS